MARGLSAGWRRWALAVLLLPVLAWAGSEAPPSKRELNTAACVAALEVSTDELAGQVKAGRQDLQPLLR